MHFMRGILKMNQDGITSGIHIKHILLRKILASDTCKVKILISFKECKMKLLYELHFSNDNMKSRHRNCMMVSLTPYSAYMLGCESDKYGIRKKQIIEQKNSIH